MLTAVSITSALPPAAPFKIRAVIYPGFTTLDLVGALQPLTQIPGVENEVVARELGANPTDAPNGMWLRLHQYGSICPVTPN